MYDIWVCSRQRARRVIEKRERVKISFKCTKYGEKCSALGAYSYSTSFRNMLSGYVQDITQACEALRVYVYGVLAAHLTGWDPKDLASYWAQSLSVHVQRSNTAILATRLPDGEAFIAHPPRQASVTTRDAGGAGCVQQAQTPFAFSLMATNLLLA